MKNIQEETLKAQKELNEYFARSLVFIHLATLKWQSYKHLKKMNKRSLRGRLSDLDFTEYARLMELERVYIGQINDYSISWVEKYKHLHGKGE